MPENTIKQGIYRHYKGGIYEVVSIAKHSESLEELVVYKNVVTEECWARPLSMWSETVGHNGASVPRFQYIAADLDTMDEKPLFRTIEDIFTLTETADNFLEDANFGFCRKSTGEVSCFEPRVVACFEGDIDEAELTASEKESLQRLESLMADSGDVASIPRDGFLDAYAVMEDFACSLPGPYQEKLLDALDG